MAHILFLVSGLLSTQESNTCGVMLFGATLLKPFQKKKPLGILPHLEHISHALCVCVPSQIYIEI